MTKKNKAFNFEGMQLKLLIFNKINSCIASYPVSTEEEGELLFLSQYGNKEFRYNFVYAIKE